MFNPERIGKLMFVVVTGENQALTAVGAVVGKQIQKGGRTFVIELSKGFVHHERRESYGEEQAKNCKAQGNVGGVARA